MEKNIVVPSIGSGFAGPVLWGGHITCNNSLCNMTELL